jgi:hypothetical protein
MDEGLFDGDSGSGQSPDVDWDWISYAIPAAKARLKELVEAGFVWQNEWQGWENEEVHSFGLTDHGRQWSVANINGPRYLDDNAAVSAWAKANNHRFTRRKQRTESALPTAKNASNFVSQTSYTPEEADAERARVREARDRGEITPGAASAYAAHITRRIVKKSA